MFFLKSSSWVSWQYSLFGLDLAIFFARFNWASHWILIASWAVLIASIISLSETSFISPSTIATLSADAPTIISISADSRSSDEGLITYLLSIRATLTSEIGPLNGMSDIAIADEAANAANASGFTFSSWELSEIIICTSAW